MSSTAWRVASMVRPGDPRDAEAMLLGLVGRWNVRSAELYPATVVVGGYAWNLDGELLAAI